MKLIYNMYEIIPENLNFCGFSNHLRAPVIRKFYSEYKKIVECVFFHWYNSDENLRREKEKGIHKFYEYKKL